MIARLRDVTYHYPRMAAPALDGVSLDVERGAFHLVTGPSAGGKSTLLRLFNGLVPQFHGGTLAGAVKVAGLDPARTPARTMATHAGMLFQVPEDQSIADTAEAEVAFGMEQVGVPRAEMRRRIDLLAGELGISELLQRPLATLSGGERQRIELAAVLALRPSLLLLDEPTSQLDPDGAERFLDALRAVRVAGDCSVLLAEHRTDRLFPVADRVLHICNGLLRSLAPPDAAATLDEAPRVSRLARRLAMQPVPLSPLEMGALPSHTIDIADPWHVPGDLLLRISGLTVRYGEFEAVGGLDLDLREGEAVALVGANGSGKTTLFRAIAGTTPIAAGEMSFRGAPMPSDVTARTMLAGLVPQDPTLTFYRDTLAAEVGATLRHRQSAAPLEDLLAQWGLDAVGGRNPRDLSIGQQARAAMATMLAHRPPVWLLDEPTRGADLAAHRRLACSLRAHAADGGAAIVATHDIESAARWATRVVALEDGRVAFDLPARQAFGHAGPMPTQVARLVPGALSVEEVVPC